MKAMTLAGLMVILTLGVLAGCSPKDSSSAMNGEAKAATSDAETAPEVAAEAEEETEVAGEVEEAAEEADVEPEDFGPFEDREAKVSYSIGVNIAKTLGNEPFEIDEEQLIQGLRDVFAGREVAVDDTARRELLMKFAQEMEIKKFQEQSAKNKAEAEAFLAENRKRKEVTELPSGLQYEVLVAGDGPKPVNTDSVRVRYRGTFIDGTEFTRSGPDDRAERLKVNGVIQGWAEALIHMPVGSKWKVFIPGNLAYGDDPEMAGGMIGPNRLLIFEIELVTIEEPATQPSGDGPKASIDGVPAEVEIERIQ